MSKDRRLLTIPGEKIFASDFSFQTPVPDPYPDGIYLIPPQNKEILYKPMTTGLDVNYSPTIFNDPSLNIEIKDLYSLFELEKRAKIQEKNSDDKIILHFSGKKMFKKENAEKMARKFDLSYSRKKKRGEGAVGNNAHVPSIMGIDGEMGTEQTTGMTREDRFEERKARLDVLYTEEMNKTYYKSQLMWDIENSFQEVADRDKTGWKHPSNKKMRAKRVWKLEPCAELMGQSVCGLNLTNKFNKAKHSSVFADQNIIGRVTKGEHQQKLFQVFGKQSEEVLGPQNGESNSEEGNGESGNKETATELQKYEIQKEFVVLKKEYELPRVTRDWLLLMNENESKIQVKPIDFSLIVRNVQKKVESKALNVKVEPHLEKLFNEKNQMNLETCGSYLGRLSRKLGNEKEKDRRLFRKIKFTKRQEQIDQANNSQTKKQNLGLQERRDSLEVDNHRIEEEVNSEKSEDDNDSIDSLLM